MDEPTHRTQTLVIRLAAEVRDPPNVGGVALFLYDLDSLYEIARLALDPAYRSHRLSRFALYRNGRPLAPADRLLVRSLTLESPLELITTIAVAATAAAAVASAVLAAVSVVERVYNLRLDREKLELEVAKLRREELQARLPLDLAEEPADPPSVLHAKGADELLETVARRLAGAPVRVTALEVEVVEERAEW